MKTSAELQAELDALKQRRADNNQARIGMSMNANKGEQLAAARLSAVHDEIAIGDTERALAVALQNEAQDALNRRVEAANEVCKDVEALGQVYVDNAAKVERAALVLNDALRELEHSAQEMHTQAGEVIRVAGLTPGMVAMPRFGGFSHRAFAVTFQKDAFEAVFRQVDLREWPVLINSTAPSRDPSMPAEAADQVAEVMQAAHAATTLALAQEQA